MNKWLALVIVALIVVAGGYYAWHQDQKPTQLQNVTISQAYSVFLYAPLYIAQDKGYFADQGLNINIATAGGDDKAFASLVSGDAQFAVGDPTFTAVAGEKGQPGVVVGSVLNGVPFWGVAEKASIPTITIPSQLGTYKVATFPAPSTAYDLQTQMFRSANLKPNIVQAAPGSVIPAVQNGSADIGLDLEPNVSTAVQQGFHVVYSLSQYYPDFAITGVTALPQYVEQNPQTVQKVINAMQEADAFIRANPAEAAALLVKDFPDVSQSVAVSALNNLISANVIPADMVTSEAGWTAAIQLRKDNGDITKDALYTTYVNTTFAENAKSKYSGK